MIQLIAYFKKTFKIGKVLYTITETFLSIFVYFFLQLKIMDFII